MNYEEEKWEANAWIFLADKILREFILNLFSTVIQYILGIEKHVQYKAYIPKGLHNYEFLTGGLRSGILD